MHATSSTPLVGRPAAAWRRPSLSLKLWVALLALGLAPGLQAGPYLQQFFPLCNGDTRDFTGTQGNVRVATSTVNYRGQSGFQLRITAGSGATATEQRRYYRVDGDRLLYLGAQFYLGSESFEATFNPPIVFLNEGTLAGGGVMEGSTSAILRGSGLPSAGFGVRVEYRYDVRVSGSLRVPACLYADSRSVEGSFTLIDPTDPEDPETIEMPEFIHLAPNVGLARIREYGVNQFGVPRPLGWAELTGGTVCGAPVCSGALRVTIQPPEVVAAGAQWRRTGTPTWRNSGDTESGLATGAAPIEFRPIAGWTTPASQTVSIVTGEPAQATATYVRQTGSLRVQIEPPEVVAAGAQWRRAGTSPWRASGSIEADVPTGAYTVEFRAVPDWIGPAPVPVSIEHGVTATVDVSYGMPPRITRPPLAITATQGGEARFAVEAVGVPPPSFAWRRNGTPLSDDGVRVTGSREPTLILRDLGLGDSGATFSVILANTGGSVTSAPVALTVVPGPLAPLLVSEPGDQRIPAGASARLAATVNGWPLPSYQWWYSATPEPAEARVLGDVADSVWEIPSVGSEHDGWYWLVAENSEGSVTSRLARLTVVHPPRIEAQPSDLTVVQGQTALFEVEVEGTPPFQYQWRFEGSDLEGQTEPSLSIPDVIPSRAGGYDFRVVNEAGTAVSRTARLEVIVPPAITLHPRDQTVCAGNRVVLETAVSGTPPPAIQWRKDGIPIPGATGPTLELPATQATDAGAYDVAANNAGGEAVTTVAHVTVNLPPNITQPPADQAAIPGSTVSFGVGVAGGGPFTYQWSKDGADLPGATGGTLVLENVGNAATGEYAVRVSNGCGTVTSAAWSLLVVDRSLRLVGGSAGPGEELTVTLEQVGDGSEVLARARLAFDDTLLAVREIERGAGAGDATLTWDRLPEGGVSMEVQMPGGRTFEPGGSALAILHLTAAADVAGSTVIPVVFGAGSVLLDAAGSELPLTAIDGAVILSGTVGLALSPASGLFEQAVTLVVPPGGVPAGQALRLAVHDLGADSRGRPIRLYRRSGETGGGVPFLDLDGPLEGGTRFTIPVQYIVLDRVTIPTPRFTVTQVAGTPVPSVAGEAIAIDPAHTRFVEGTLYLQFLTHSGRTYRVQYKDDLGEPEWRTAPAPIAGTGGWVVWADPGPPVTASSPGPARYYRAVQVP
ncbi:MAG: immunoglobulin domain-containing protein [Verrucomicrobiae bacterium]|nr:immunoglobulin domain-containing protein [Verrucomicrobiae bacterium]